MCSQAELDALRKETRDVVLAAHVRDYAIALVLGTHPTSDHAPDAVREYVRHGASPRGLLSLIMTSKALALMDERLNVSFEDVAEAAPHALRHRVMQNFEAEASGITVNELLATLLDDCKHLRGGGRG